MARLWSFAGQAGPYHESALEALRRGRTSVVWTRIDYDPAVGGVDVADMIDKFARCVIDPAWTWKRPSNEELLAAAARAANTFVVSADATASAAAYDAAEKRWNLYREAEKNSEEPEAKNNVARAELAWLAAHEAYNNGSLAAAAAAAAEIAVASFLEDLLMKTILEDMLRKVI